MEENTNALVEQELETEVIDATNDESCDDSVQYVSYGSTILKGIGIGAGGAIGAVAFKKFVFPKIKTAWKNHKAKKAAKKAEAEKTATEEFNATSEETTK